MKEPVDVLQKLHGNVLLRSLNQLLYITFDNQLSMYITYYQSSQAWIEPFFFEKKGPFKIRFITSVQGRIFDFLLKYANRYLFPIKASNLIIYHNVVDIFR